jgi:hypothetical protein
MPDAQSLGRLLIVRGTILLVTGLMLTLTGRLPFLHSLGRLPGDIVWRRGSTTIYLPITTSLLLSLLLSIVLAVVVRR